MYVNSLSKSIIGHLGAGPASKLSAILPATFAGINIARCLAYRGSCTNDNTLVN